MNWNIMHRYAVKILAPISLCAVMALPCPAAAGLLISEVACGTSGGDWVELFLDGVPGESLDISRLYVTMYFGTNESLGADPITLYAADLPGTPYDDRYAVVHLTAPGTPDETDFTGDTNRNGVLDIYCCNYSGSLWNTDCVVAVDSDDDPSNGGMIDFIAYSVMDESFNSTMESYMHAAAATGQWTACDPGIVQSCLVPLPAEGLASHQSISRLPGADRNSREDFAVTPFQTPGRPNIFPGTEAKGARLFSLPQTVFSILPHRTGRSGLEIPLQVLEPCNVRFRIFSSDGLMVHESPLYRSIAPGAFSLRWNLKGKGRRASTGLYIGVIECTGTAARKSESKTLHIILSRYK
jgi:hypothetical protein